MHSTTAARAAVASIVLSTIAAVAPPAAATPVTAAPVVDRVVTHAAASAETPPSKYHGIAPTRVLDTRREQSSSPPLNAGVTVHQQIPGLSAVPADATAVALTLTVVAPRANGYLTASKHGTVRPPTSTVTFERNRTVANSVYVPIGVHGWVDLYNGSPDVIDLIVDVTGYWSAASAGAAGQLVSVTPTRVFDTKLGVGGSAIPADGQTTVPIAGTAGVPTSGASAAIVQIAARTPAKSGYLTAWAAGTSRPNASSVVFTAGTTTTTQAVVPLGSDGRIALANGSPARLDALVDVIGYITSGDGAAAGSLVALRPSRILDTRNGIGADAVQVPGGRDVPLTVSGRGGVPASGATAVLLSVTATREQAAGYLNVYPNGQARIIQSVVNWTPLRTTSDLVLVPIGSLGSVRLYNGSSGRADFIADVVGYINAG